MANEVLIRTPTSTGNRKVFTWSGWIKRNFVYSGSGNFYQGIFGVGTVDASEDTFMFSDNKIRLRCETGTDIETVEKFRDAGNWMHIMMVADSTKSTSTDRLVFYVNGARVIGGSVTQNLQFRFNSISAHYLGEFPRISAHLDGQICDVFFIDGQALTPDVFGFYKDGKGYQSSGTSQATDFRPGQWVPKTPRVIKTEINRRGGFGVNGFYLPMNDSSNFGADFHTTPNSIITLKGEDLPQPRNGAPTTSDSYVSQLRTDPYAANLVLAIPFISGGLGTDGTSGGNNTGFGDYSHIINASQTTKDVQLITYNGTTPTIVSSENYSTNYYGSACYIDGNGSAHAGGHIRVVDDNIFDDLNLTTANWTIEGWFNPASRSTGGSNLFNFGDATDYNQIQVILDPSGDPWHLWSYTGSAWNVNDSGTTARPALNQWSHIAFEKVGTATTSYITTYVNGVTAKVTAVPQNINYSSNPRLIIGGHYVSGGSGGDTYYYDGLVSDVRMYNIAKYKGGFDVPKPYTPVGIESWRQVPDTCKNNFATLNSLDYNSSTTALSDGNLTMNATSNNGSVYSATYNVPNSGKYYFEFYEKVIDVTTTNYISIVSVKDDSKYQQYRGYGYIYTDGVQATGYATMDEGDLVGVAIDADNGTVSFYNNGTLVATVTSSSVDHVRGAKIRSYLPRGAGSYPPGDTRVYNFGQNPTFSGTVTAGTNADASGKGLFKYAPPTGFLALCEDNLSTPAIADPGEYFKTVLYEGDNVSNGVGRRAVRGVGFKPDLVWIKCRDQAQNHVLYDSVRGLQCLNSNDTAAESTFDSQILGGYDEDGFTTSPNNDSNYNGQSFVAWCWKAGGASVSNTDGSITSQVSANQTAGFSIVSYTGNGSSGTVGHGLGKTPNIVIVKNRIDSSNWSFNGNIGGLVYGTNKMVLQGTGGITSDTNEVMSANATTLTLGNSGATNGSSDAQIAYCWTEIEGYSKFGSYVGNGSADGPFVYCGFKPAFLMIKRTDTTGEWWMYDNSRGPTNPIPRMLMADNALVEQEDSASYLLDFLSNGFKWRSGLAASNGNGGSFIFMAFAESPFQTANAK